MVLKGLTNRDKTGSPIYRLKCRRDILALRAVGAASPAKEQVYILGLCFHLYFHEPMKMFVDWLDGKRARSAIENALQLLGSIFGVMYILAHSRS